ncbi:topoisomerase C-terminal repeat-containing protein [Pedobacter sp. ISL-68]|uniref:type IA DNA topoisomerase n=1 Tax=unclassified Pedobacter TaxID=2628915 RepID=UPI001BE95735|nr:MULTISPECIES: type IA DNA topoisomerase [unclassified Pedobacter]MBT2559794.1 topoisomerase C-terminal repeat-containing protein [Pedobacter sp. ISL-64]MBT2592099.1 topoisomerase C-terminal repeat-containing protein [Pedobacter sp. ISL-68]
MKLVIAEKPSVAREIAGLLRALDKNEGYLSGEGYCVTWAFGHLITLAMPEDYGIAGFNKESLPILPDPFLLTIRKIKKEKSYVIDPGAAKQVKIIERKLKECESIIVATDAGREGELIFRYIYEYLKCDKPFERLWISSLTEKAIKLGFMNLKPGNDFDNLYFAAQSRSKADWLVGINASQALSISAGYGIYSLGRVQTPTLALICKRFYDHKNFSVQKYWQIQLHHTKDSVDFTSISKTKWDNQKKGEDALKLILRSGTGVVTNAETKKVSEQAPLLFDLTGLQKECNKKLNLSAEETLNIAQSLYEKQFITYPRTGSCYIPEDVWPEIPHLIKALNDRKSLLESVSKVKLGHLSKRIVNDLKVTDHHGLLITEKVPSALPGVASAVYDMIAYRMLESVSPPCQKEIVTISIEALHYEFSSRGTQIIEPGWRIVRGDFSEDNEDLIEPLPVVKSGDRLKIVEANVVEKETKAPALYTEASLLAAMETCGKEIENTDERKALQNIGLGTPATRAAVIGVLFNRDYIRREKKSLLPTEKGLKVYELVKEKKIADVTMTGEWECALQKIENGETSSDDFQREIEQYTKSITEDLLSVPLNNEKLPDLLCPKCKVRHLIIRDKVVKCPDAACSWILFRGICGVQLSLKEVENLISKRNTSLIKGMTSKAGKKFDARITLNDQAETAFEFDNNKFRKK